MSSYKVKLGEEILTVEGLPGLVKLVQEGRLTPEDPVFIPSTNRWHYARSVRQLRAFFPGTPEPPREEPPVVSAPGAARPAPPSPPGEVVRFRRGSWSPEGRIEVPVFNYEVDADPPTEVKWVRRAIVVGFGLFGGLLAWIYVAGYANYLEGYEQSITLPSAVPVKTPPTPKATKTARAGAATPTPIAAATTAALKQTPTPVATASFDEAAALQRVMKASTSRVLKPADLGEAIRKDLTKIAVPVRSISFAPKKGVKGPAAPFVGVVEYVRADKIDDAAVAKHRYMTIAMIGRRAKELNLRLDSVRFLSTRGKTRTETLVSADTVFGIASGSVSAASLDRR